MEAGSGEVSTNVASCGELRERVDLYDTLPDRICATDALVAATSIPSIGALV
jgi:hypothetical protein